MKANRLLPYKTTSDLYLYLCNIFNDCLIDFLGPKNYWKSVPRSRIHVYVCRNSRLNWAFRRQKWTLLWLRNSNRLSFVNVIVWSYAAINERVGHRKLTITTHCPSVHVAAKTTLKVIVITPFDNVINHARFEAVSPSILYASLPFNDRPPWIRLEHECKSITVF